MGCQRWVGSLDSKAGVTGLRPHEQDGIPRIMSCPRAAVCGISSRGPFCGSTVHPPLGAACFPSAKAFVQDWLVTQRLYSFGLPRLVQARSAPVILHVQDWLVTQRRYVFGSPRMAGGDHLAV